MSEGLRIAAEVRAYLDVLAWPGVAFTGLLVFRRQLGGLVDRVAKISIGDKVVELRDQRDAAEIQAESWRAVIRQAAQGSEPEAVASPRLDSDDHKARETLRLAATLEEFRPFQLQALEDPQGSVRAAYAEACERARRMLGRVGETHTVPGRWQFVRVYGLTRLVSSLVEDRTGIDPSLIAVARRIEDRVEDVANLPPTTTAADAYVTAIAALVAAFEAASTSS